MFGWINQQVQNTVMPPNAPLVIRRKQECARCPKLMEVPVVTAVMGPQCEMCGCFLNAKTRIIKERCPLGKW